MIKQIIAVLREGRGDLVECIPAPPITQALRFFASYGANRDISIGRTLWWNVREGIR